MPSDVIVTSRVYARAATRRVRLNRLSAMGRMQTSKEGVQAAACANSSTSRPQLHCVLSITRHVLGRRGERHDKSCAHIDSTSG